MTARVCVFLASAFFGFAFGAFLFLLWAVREINEMKGNIRGRKHDEFGQAQSCGDKRGNPVRAL